MNENEAHTGETHYTGETYTDLEDVVRERKTLKLEIFTLTVEYLKGQDRVKPEQLEEYLNKVYQFITE